MKNSRRIVYLILILAMFISGCGSLETSGENGKIALLEPVNDSSDWEVAAYRNLYDTKIYPATVYPYTEEYSFKKNVTFDHFCVYPGESVKRNAVLAYADDSELEKRIKDKEEQIREMEEQFLEYKKETEESLYESQSDVDRLKGIVETLQGQKPEEYLPAGGDASETDGGRPGKNPEYLQWEAMFNRFEGDYRIKAHNLDIARTKLEQRTQLYELDHAYALKQLQGMKNELSLGVLTSSMEGSVVAVGSMGNGQQINEKEKVIAIGDMEHKLLKCQYINKSTAKKAKDIYAIIDGRRYEIVYQPIDSDEYSRLSALNETIYSTFEFAEAADEISAGDFVMITVVNDIRENVLSVSKSALHKDATGTFVYVLKGEESVAVNVETGMSDGVYTEILSGIEAGDKIMATEVITPGENRAVVKKGNFHSNFSGNGYMIYPSASWVSNPVTHGTVYFVEYLADLYEHVEKGDVIARIRVQPDELALQRNLVRLERLRERLADLKRENAEANEKLIAAREKEIDKVQQLVNEIRADFATTEIRASQSGTIVAMWHYQPEDIVYAKGLFVDIAEESTCYVALENSNQLLQYGNEVTISYSNGDNSTGTARGVVANLSEGGVSSSLKSDYSLVLLPEEVIGDMASAVPDWNGYMVRAHYKVNAVIREMDNVLVVPRDAVWDVSGQTYVLVEQEDGTIVAQSFIAGGYDASNYWVVDGLTEGMKICLK